MCVSDFMPWRFGYVGNSAVWSHRIGRRPTHGRCGMRYFQRMPQFKTAGRMVLLVAGLAAGCAPSSQVLTGTARPPITPDQVKIYSSPPAQFQEIAVLDASSKSAFGTGGQKSVDKVVAPEDRSCQIGRQRSHLGGLSGRADRIHWFGRGVRLLFQSFGRRSRRRWFARNLQENRSWRGHLRASKQSRRLSACGAQPRCRLPRTKAMASMLPCASVSSVQQVRQAAQSSSCKYYMPSCRNRRTSDVMER